MNQKEIKSFKDICRIAAFHEKRGEYDLAKPYHIQIVDFYASHPDDCKMLDEINMRISREVHRELYPI